jgi:hypothetical protein
MNISDIQKAKFLETIFKIYYALGSAPSDNEVSTLYGRYFSRFLIGQSIPVPYSDISSESIIDPDKLNRVMVHILFNLDVVYEAYHNHVEELYDLITAFSKRIESIKSKRAELEKKVDDQLFSLRNTDGFYYSITNAFNDTSLTDLNYTTALVDTVSRKAAIPKITSGNFDYVGNILNGVGSVNVTTIFEGSEVKSEVVSFNNVFNGLTNSEWTYKYKSTSIGLCTLKIVVPISSIATTISLVEGRLSSQKPVDIGIIVVDPKDRSKSASYLKPGSRDHDTFTFSFTPQLSSAVEIYLTKDEPDYVSTDNETAVYNYDFRLDELIISSPYYDFNAILVSQPMSVPTENNSNLIIDAVSISAEEQVPQGADIRYYIAPDNPGAINVYDYNWVSISPTSVRSPMSPTVINFNGTTFFQATVAASDSSNIVSSGSLMYKIPRSDGYSNPIQDYFYKSDSVSLDFNLYRFAKFPDQVRPYDCYILENVDKNQLTVRIAADVTLDKDTWQSLVTGQRNDIVYTSFSRDIPNTQTFFTADNIPYGSIYMSTNIFSETNLKLTETFLKDLSAQYWDIRIYLNGVDITANGPLSPGVLSSSLTWDVKAGKNEIIILINKSTNDTFGVETPFNGSIALFKDRSILSLNGVMPYKNYLYEVKAEDLRLYYSNVDSVFSIINYENNYEIVYRRTEEIKEGSKIYYYTNSESGVQAIRLRVDLFRGPSSDSGPSINSYTVKFRH